MTNSGKKAIAYCNREGVIGFGAEVPRRTFALAQGEETRLREKIGELARRADNGETLLVPGVAEAKDNDTAMAACWEFQEALQLDTAEKEVA